MEITLEAIIGLISLLVGGTGVGGFLFWRQHKRKEEAEAKRNRFLAAAAVFGVIWLMLLVF